MGMLLGLIAGYLVHRFWGEALEAQVKKIVDAAMVKIKF
jgi:uncharacterized membrane-anchored protein YhcB (DUF1043 family)